MGSAAYRHCFGVCLWRLSTSPPANPHFAACRQQLPSSLADQGAARLLQAEALVSQQQEQLGVLARQLNKLQTRARITGRDLRLPIKQVGLVSLVAPAAGVGQPCGDLV